MKIFVAYVVAGLVGALAASAQAGLTWETTEADLHPSLSDTTSVAHFKYTNTGDKPVKIITVHPSCGCTTAALAKDTVAPKESGEITATFKIGDRSGVQKKTIAVVTDDQPNNPTMLHLTATIPQLLKIAPSFVYWSATDKLDPKTITVDVGGDFPVTKLDVTSTDKSISTEVEPVPDKKEFKVILKPTESGRPINAALKIKPDYPKDQPKTFYANVRIDSRATMPK